MRGERSSAHQAMLPSSLPPPPHHSTAPSLPIMAGTLVVGSALGTFVDTYLDYVNEQEASKKLEKKLDAADFLEADDDGRAKSPRRSLCCTSSR